MLRAALRRPQHSNYLSFFHLPPPIRLRAFHATVPRRIYSEAIHASYEAIQAVHTFSGTSWALTIPLIALLVRAGTLLPIAIIQRRAYAQQVSLVPLLLAWKHTLRKETMYEVGHLGPAVLQKTLNLKMKAKKRELFKRHHCGSWKNYLFIAHLPVFLSVMDILRRMTGMQGLWIIEALSGLFSGQKKASIESLNDMTGDIVVKATFVPMELDFAIEGMLWFPNLLLPDPQLVLPFMLSGVILLNIFGHRKPVTPLGKLSTALKKVFGFGALFVGPMMLTMPSAMMLYWISSSFLNWLQLWLIEWWIPISPPMKPLLPKRPWNTGLAQQNSASGKEAKEFDKNLVL